MKPSLIAYSAREWLDMADVQRDWLIPQLLGKGESLVIHGASQSFKSWLSLQLCFDLSAGVAPLGIFDPPDEPMNTLILEGEGSPGAWKQRIALMAAHYPDHALDRQLSAHILARPLTDPATYAEATDLVRESGAAFVVIDTRSQFFAGDENDVKEVNSWADLVTAWRRDSGCASSLVQHNRKPSKAPDASGRWVKQAQDENDLRGSGGFMANCDLMFGMNRDHANITMTIEKQRDGEFVGREYKFRFQDNHLVCVTRGDAVECAISAALAGGIVMTRPDLTAAVVAATRLSESTVSDTIKRMGEDGVLSIYTNAKTHTVKLR